MKEKFGKLKVGKSLDESAYLGPVVSKAQYEKVNAYVELALDEAKVVIKGELAPELNNGYFVEPLIVTGVDRNHRLAQEEIFGPLTVVLPVKNFDEAIEVANDSKYGLSASLFTNDMSKIFRFF